MLRPLLAASLAVAAATACHADGGEPPAPRLILWITVDQLRGDVLPRLEGRLGPGGFRRLLDEGAVWTNAHYRHLVTRTAPGHATLFTGTDPREHGIVANDWVAADGSRQYCVDPPPGDPAAGKGPWHLERPTVGDRLIEHDPRARVYGVSLKDRGAIFGAGLRGAAVWFDRSAGRFVTGPAYAAADPGLAAWLADWNDDGDGRTRADRFASSTWSLLYPAETYAAWCDGPAAGCLSSDPFERSPFRDADGRRLPNPPFPLGGPTRPPDLRLARRLLRATPFADELTARLALDLAAARDLGADDVTDLLAVSFSALDYAGHEFGPDSLEYEDVVLRLDRTLADAFAALDSGVGAGRWIAVLSSDHGTGAIPAYAAALGERTGEMPDDAELTARANAALRSALGVEADLVAWYEFPGFALDRRAVARERLAPDTVAAALAREVVGWEGVRTAFTHAALRGDPAEADDPLLAMARRSFHPDRLQDVVVVLDPHRFDGSATGNDAAMHGSPYAHDTWVPIAILAPCAAPGRARCLAPRHVARRAGPHQIASTVLWLAGDGDGDGGLPVAD